MSALSLSASVAVRDELPDSALSSGALSSALNRYLPQMCDGRADGSVAGSSPRVSDPNSLSTNFEPQSAQLRINRFDQAAKNAAKATANPEPHVGTHVNLKSRHALYTPGVGSDVHTALPHDCGALAGTDLDTLVLKALHAGCKDFGPEKHAALKAAIRCDAASTAPPRHWLKGPLVVAALKVLCPPDALDLVHHLPGAPVPAPQHSGNTDPPLAHRLITSRELGRQ